MQTKQTLQATTIIILRKQVCRPSDRRAETYIRWCWDAAN